MVMEVGMISVCGDQNLISGEVFSKAQTDLVRDFGGEIIIGTEGLNDVNISPAVSF